MSKELADVRGHSPSMRLPKPPRPSIADAVALACAAERDKLGRELTDAEHGCIRAGYHAGLSRGWADPRPRYTVRWRRLSPVQPGTFSPPTDAAAPLECVHLRERDLVRRLIGAIENSGPVLIEAVERERIEATGASRDGETLWWRYGPDSDATDADGEKAHAQTG